MSLALAATLAACATGGCGRSGARRSILLVVVDTLRADALGCYGGERGLTPRLDAFARDEAVLFENAWAASSWTLPSFGTILTGAPPSTHGAGRLDDGFSPLRERIPTLARILADRRYLTMAIVENPFLGREFALDRGFARYDHERGTNAVSRRADEVTRRALDWAYTVGDRPFFLLVHYFDPHLDYDPPAAFRERFLPDGEEDAVFPAADQRALKTGERAPSEAELKRIRRLYDGEVAFVDEQVGLLLDGMKRTGLDRHLVVVVTSDHGEEFFEHGGFEHGHSLHGEVARVPLLVRVPGAPRREARVADLASHADILPTVLAAIGETAPPPAHVTGRDLLAPVSGAPPRDVLVEGTLYGAEVAGLLSGSLKWSGPPASLFDLAADPREERNLAESDKRAAALSRACAEARAAAEAAGEAFGRRIPADLETETRRALGIPYLEDPRRGR